MKHTDTAATIDATRIAPEGWTAALSSDDE